MINQFLPDSLNKFFAQLKGKWKVIALFAIVGGILAFTYATFRTPRYKAVATIMIAEDSRPGALNLVNRLSLGNLLGGSASVDNEQYVIGSHEVFLNMVKQLGLNVRYTLTDGIKKKTMYPVAPLMMVCDTAISDTLSTTISFKAKISEDGLLTVKAKNGKGETIGTANDKTIPYTLHTDYGEFSFITGDNYKFGKAYSEKITIYNYSQAAQDYARLVKIAIPSKRADVLSLSITHSNTELAKLILASLIDFYNLSGNRQKHIKGEQTLSIINDRINAVQEDLAHIEDVIASYKQQSNITDVRTDVAYAYEVHGELQKSIIQQETLLQVLLLTKEYLSKSGENVLIPQLSFGEDNVIPVGEYNALLLRRIELSKTAKPGNVALNNLDEQIAAVKSSIENSVNRTIANVKASIAELNNKDKETITKLGSMPKQERELREVLRTQTIDEQIYVFLLEQREQIAMTSFNNLPRGQIVDKPYILDEVQGMGRIPFTFIGIVFGFIAIIMVYYFLYLIGTIKNN